MADDRFIDGVFPAAGIVPEHPSIELVEIWRQVELAEEILADVRCVDEASLMTDERFYEILSRPSRSYRAATSWRLLPPPVGSFTRTRHGQ